MIALFLLFANGVELKSDSNGDKIDFCETLQCSDSVPICGIRQEGEGYRLRLFDNECELLKYGCKVQNDLAYGAVSIDYCDKTFENLTLKSETTERCPDYDCSYPTDTKEVCGLRKDGDGFRVRLFNNRCELWKHNCENNITFTESETNFCSGLTIEDNKTDNEEKKKVITPKILDRNIIVVDNSMLNFNNYNESIENFFAATHVFDLPVRDVQKDVNETSRRMLVKVFGPAKVFKPWTTIPKNMSAIGNDIEHEPTLSSCYHKCPKKCPDTYAPVCGVPGIVAREPNLMFKNHCFMDVAQCKMYFEDKSDTSISSSYIESSFLFCLGDQLNGLYRFLPLLRTLQHMGRVKSKGIFRYKITNMRFFNNLLPLNATGKNLASCNWDFTAGAHWATNAGDCQRDVVYKVILHEPQGAEIDAAVCRRPGPALDVEQLVHCFI